jgi:dTDP-4-dehydrorhamnose reductase
LSLKNKSILLFGAKGMLSNDFIPLVQDSKLYPFDIEDLDITKKEDVKNLIEKIKPDILLNFAAYTAVDKCETEPISLEVNGKSLETISTICASTQTKLVHISTDYIFSDLFDSPIPENAKPNPINSYGRGKLMAEELILKTKNLDFLILRVQWLYGKKGKNFVDTMLKLSETKKEISVVADQIGRPTSTVFLAQLIHLCLEKNLSGIYHLGPKDFCSWFEFASYILKDKDVLVKSIPSSEYPTPAKRPLYSVLGLEKIQKDLKGEIILEKTWKELVDEYLNRN